MYIYNTNTYRLLNSLEGCICVWVLWRTINSVLYSKDIWQL